MINQTIEKLSELRLRGFVQGVREQLEDSKYNELSFEQRLAMLVDREHLRRENSRLSRRLSQARLKQSATIENINFQIPRKLKKALLLDLASGSWIHNKHNLFITGPTGIGKSYIACALADKACRLGFSALYIKTSNLIPQLLLARADGSYPSLATKLAKVQLLLIDEWLRDPLTESQARELQDIIDDRYGVSSSIFISQLKVKDWHKNISDPTIADAILDRIVHNAIKMDLDGESVRKLTSMLKQTDKV